MTAFECTHPESETTRQVCLHLLQYGSPRTFQYYQYFKGQDLQYALVCDTCNTHKDSIAASLVPVCAACFTDMQKRGNMVGIARSPDIKVRALHLQFTHRIVAIPDFADDPLADIQPLSHLWQSNWVGLTQSGRLVRVALSDPPLVDIITTLSDAQLEVLMGVRPNRRRPLHMTLDLAPNGEMAVVYSRTGEHGFVFDLTTGQLLMSLQRDGYHSDISSFPVAFFMDGERLLLVHSSAWNRLDIYDPRTGEVLTKRDISVYPKGGPAPAHYLDYFHGHLTVAPDYDWIADDGWVWQPDGILTLWSLKRWLENVWESEDGDSLIALTYRDWGYPVCWIDNRTLAVWGYGDEGWIIPAVQLFDVELVEWIRWFPGPDVSSRPREGPSQTYISWNDNRAETRDALVFDTYLFSVSELIGIAVWDIETGARLHHDPSFSPIRYHRGTKEFLSHLPNGDFKLSRLEFK